MQDRVVSLRLSSGVLEQLHAVAAVETLRRGRRVSWSQLVREVIDRHLLKPYSGHATITFGEQDR